MPAEYKEVMGCPTEPSPDEKCQQFKNLFDPPAENCIFKIEYGTSCEDGNNVKVEYSYRVKASDGRISEWQHSGRTAENEGVECLDIINSCPDSKLGCWQDVDTGNCVYRDTDGNYKLRPECHTTNSPGDGGGKPGTGSGDDNSGGGTGEGDDLGNHSGDGGKGGLGDLDGMDKGENDLFTLVDSLLNDFNNSYSMQIIRDHDYITIVGPKCYLDYSFWGRNHQIDFCRYEPELRKFGNILLGVISILSFVYVLRS